MGNAHSKKFPYEFLYHKSLLCSDETYYTNMAYTESIVREDNPVTGFIIKERSNRNTKTTL